jgi:hypothetical protein
MEQNVNVVRHAFRRYVLQAKFHSTPHEIDHERPTGMAVAIAAHDDYRRPDRFELVENALATNVAKMPDFISGFGDADHILRQTIVCVSEHENSPRLLC